ncbi:UrcA family protein [Sphingomonas sp. MMS12-HWE2-04]|uniref:UrcA family protein n=1 Tax=Sphingomonas sp. MMS12-HWE2-04 TaxID=3234199 RepID=UPI00384DE2A4
MLKLVLFAAVAAGCAVPAYAQNWDGDREWRSVRVDASALDLSTDSGVDELEKRVGKAVNRICGSDSACRDDAWASADAQVADAIRRDEWMRRMAEERIAQLDHCRWNGCAPAQPVYYAPPPPPPVNYVPAGGVTVTIITTPGYVVYR